MKNENARQPGWDYIADATGVAQRAIDGAGDIAASIHSMAVGDVRALALQKVGRTAAVLVLICVSDLEYLAITVFLCSAEESLWRPVESIRGTRWQGDSFTRPDESWQGRGPVRNLAVNGYAPQNDGEDHKSNGRTDAPLVGWKCVTGVASRQVSRVGASSSIEARENLVHPGTGAFLVLLRAPWREDLVVNGIDLDGQLLTLDAPT